MTAVDALAFLKRNVTVSWSASHAVPSGPESRGRTDGLLGRGRRGRRVAADTRREWPRTGPRAPRPPPGRRPRCPGASSSADRRTRRPTRAARAPPRPGTPPPPPPPPPRTPPHPPQPPPPPAHH